MYVCFSIIQFLSFFSTTKADGLANETDVQMDASTDRLVVACGHPRTTIQIGTEAWGLAEEPA